MTFFLSNLENSWLGITDMSVNKTELQKYKDYRFMNEFIRNLTDFSLYLKRKTEQNKVEIAEVFIRKMNNILIERRKTSETKFVDQIPGQLIIPFQLKGDAPGSLAVVGILNEEIMCFETHKRVPYRIVFECVELAN